MTLWELRGKMAHSKGTMSSMSSYKGTLNYDILRRDNQAHLRRINNIFIETELCVKGLRSVLKEVASDKEHKTNEPSSRCGTNRKR
jgi:hypothetical protein